MVIVVVVVVVVDAVIGGGQMCLWSGMAVVSRSGMEVVVLAVVGVAVVGWCDAISVT